MVFATVPLLIMGGMVLLVGIPTDLLYVAVATTAAGEVIVAAWALRDRTRPTRMSHFFFEESANQKEIEFALHRAIEAAGRTATKPEEIHTSKYPSGRFGRRWDLDIPIFAFAVPEVGDWPRLPPHIYLITRDQSLREQWIRLKGAIIEAAGVAAEASGMGSRAPGGYPNGPSMSVYPNPEHPNFDQRPHDLFQP